MISFSLVNSFIPAISYCWRWCLAGDSLPSCEMNTNRTGEVGCEKSDHRNGAGRRIDTVSERVSLWHNLINFTLLQVHCSRWLSEKCSDDKRAN